MFCPNCGFEVENGAKFCPNCGRVLYEAENDNQNKIRYSENEKISTFGDYAEENLSELDAEEIRFERQHKIRKIIAIIVIALIAFNLLLTIVSGSSIFISLMLWVAAFVFVVGGIVNWLKKK